MTSVKFPRRYYQRLAFSKRQARTGLKGSSSYNVPQTCEPRARTKGRLARAHKNEYSDSVPSLDSGLDYPSDSDCESDQDSGYSSGSGHDEVAETHGEMRVRFAAEGPIMPKLADGSTDRLKTEELKWKE
jgi:hypothetical protein